MATIIASSDFSFEAFKDLSPAGQVAAIVCSTILILATMYMIYKLWTY